MESPSPSLDPDKRIPEREGEEFTTVLVGEL
jgi:hypothetical protein